MTEHLYKLSELKGGVIKVLSTGSWAEMHTLKKILFSKLRGSLIIEKVS